MKSFFRSKRLIVLSLVMMCMFGIGMCLLFSPVHAEVQTTPTGVWTDYAVAPTLGDGSEGNPYQIATAENLAWVASQTNAGTDFRNAFIKQTANIDLASHYWVPIGTRTNSYYFNGNYNGADYEIYNIFIDGNYEYYGLFGYVYDNIQGSSPVIMQKIHVSNIEIICQGENQFTDTVGGIAGNVREAQISNCSVNGLIIQDETVNTSSGRCLYAGGLVGDAYGCTIENCAVNNFACGDENILGDAVGNYSRIGGIVSRAGNTSISLCSIQAMSVIETKTSSGMYNIGGVVGEIIDGSTDVTISNCSFTQSFFHYTIHSDITSELILRIGGISGDSVGVTITNCDLSGLEIVYGAYYESWANIKDNVGKLVNDSSVLIDGCNTATCTITKETLYHNWIDYWKAPINGDGSSSNPYKIATAENLAWVAYMTNNNLTDTRYSRAVSSAYFIQTADINLAGRYWVPIGTQTYPFQGSYNGQNNTISNMTTINVDYSGLFGNASGGVGYLNFYNAKVTGSKYVGTAIGCADKQVIREIMVSNSQIVGMGTKLYVGGIFGEASLLGSQVKMCGVYNSEIKAISNQKNSDAVASGIGCGRDCFYCKVEKTLVLSKADDTDSAGIGSGAYNKVSSCFVEDCVIKALDYQSTEDNEIYSGYASGVFSTASSLRGCSIKNTEVYGGTGNTISSGTGGVTGRIDGNHSISNCILINVKTNGGAIVGTTVSGSNTTFATISGCYYELTEDWGIDKVTEGGRIEMTNCVFKVPSMKASYITSTGYSSLLVFETQDGNYYYTGTRLAYDGTEVEGAWRLTSLGIVNGRVLPTAFHITEGDTEIDLFTELKLTRLGYTEYLLDI